MERHSVQHMERHSVQHMERHSVQHMERHSVQHMELLKPVYDSRFSNSLGISPRFI